MSSLFKNSPACHTVHACFARPKAPGMQALIILTMVMLTGCASSTPPQTTSTPLVAITAAPQDVDADGFLGAEFMQSPLHSVAPMATVDGPMLRFTVRTADETIRVIGTEQTKMLIREIRATDALRQRTVLEAMAGAAKDRTTNLVSTPYRLSKVLVDRAGDIDDPEEALMFVPQQVGGIVGDLLNGLGELTVTGARISTGAAATDCSGLGCVEKARDDIWSGVNSLAGKHNAARRLHREFGTDPDTQNDAYRREIDRLSYAEAYTSTTIKLGAGQAGIDYLSQAFVAVGYVNNGEFIGQYEDAHRQRNFEKTTLLGWGVKPNVIDGFYQNKAFTKQHRRRLFAALDALPDKAFAVDLFQGAADTRLRYEADRHVATYIYIAALSKNGKIAAYAGAASDPLTPKPLIVTHDDTVIWPIYADYLAATPEIIAALDYLASRSGHGAVHVLGRISAEIAQQAYDLGIDVVELPNRE